MTTLSMLKNNCIFNITDLVVSNIMLEREREREREREQSVNQIVMIFYGTLSSMKMSCFENPLKESIGSFEGFFCAQSSVNRKPFNN